MAIFRGLALAASTALDVAFPAACSGCGREGESLCSACLPALDARGIAAITVAHTSARIGDALSSYQDGIVSAANAAALHLGACVEMPARGVLDRLSLSKT